MEGVAAASCRRTRDGAAADDDLDEADAFLVAVPVAEVVGSFRAFF